MARYIIGIDQSTQGTKALLVDETGHLLARADRSHEQIVNDAGWVSHNPAEIAANVVAVAREVVEKGGADPAEIAGIGISNQRETTVAWNARTGEPLCDAVVWQCARARELCERLANTHPDMPELVKERTGLDLSPYYPAAKMAWILANVPEAAQAAQDGELCLGTIDAWVIWSLTGGATFSCDYSNASRTQLFDIQAGSWSEDICKLFGIDVAWLPKVLDSDACFGQTDLDGFLPAPVPINGVLGDSHAALFAQGCFERGMAKATMGTGSSIMMNIGSEFAASKHGLSTSLAWRMAGTTEYVFEGNINYAGAVITWLKDDLKLIEDPNETAELAFSANPSSRVYFVPAFTGLGAPHWDSDVQACVFGMDRTTGKAEFVKAANECIAFQIYDVVEAMAEDSGSKLSELRVDGGPTRNAFLMQFLSDMCAAPIRIASNDEMSGLGAAWTCGIALGMYGRDVVSVYGARGIVEPSINPDKRKERLCGWHHAIEAAIAYSH